MPISMEEWNSGRVECTLKKKLETFLEKNPDKAFNLREILEGTGYCVTVTLMGYGATPELKFRHTLETLADEGIVEIRIIKKSIVGEELYYKAVNAAQ